MSNIWYTIKDLIRTCWREYLHLLCLVLGHDWRLHWVQIDYKRLELVERYGCERCESMRHGRQDITDTTPRKRGRRSEP